MKFNLKHRHLLSRAGNIRLRYVIIAVCVVVSVFLFSLSDDGTVTVDIPKLDVAMPIVEQNEHIEDYPDTITYDPEQAGNGIAPFLTRIGTRPNFDKVYYYQSTKEIQSGDVLSVVIEETGLSGDDYRDAMKAIKAHISPQDLRPGHEVAVTYARLGREQHIAQVAYIFDSLKSVNVYPNKDGVWIAELHEKPLETKTRAGIAVIENSLYGSMGKVGIPDGIINRMIKAYSWTVDFQRDIWGGETVEVLYETKESEDGDYVRSNRLLYANLKLRNKDLPIYLYEKDKGFPNYFEPNGQSIRRALMKTPVDGARLSSGYGMRKHPVLGYNKMHKGLDFAAPTGTPIYAAGDGVVERANRFGAYGNYIRIRHNNTYKTAYAHLHKFAKGMGSGKRVKQGEVIGYVGSTGRSTGPHLHYEVIKNGRQVNPHSVDLPLGEQIPHSKMDHFRATLKKLNAAFTKLTGIVPGQNATMVKPVKKPVI